MSKMAGIAAFIEEKRKAHNLTQADLALKAGVGIRLVRDLEQGRERDFHIEKINAILWLFGYQLGPVPAVRG